jgi:5-bromo-4-chloroindolyl phosphate hydrolysis protein
MINLISFLVILTNAIFISILQNLDIMTSFIASIVVSLVLFPISALEFGIFYILFALINKKYKVGHIHI